jgi:bacillithiol biosynthesis cysteine-adding enzyme BshC
LPIEATVRYESLSGFNAIWTSAAEGADSLRQLFLRTAAEPESVEAACEAQLAQPRDWRALAKILEAEGKRYGVPPAALSRLEALAAGKAAAVVTAQQVGYLGGPFYTFLKAFHCVRLASALEARLRVPILPIFWLEGEDHDLAEVADSYYLEESGDVGHVTFPPEQPLAKFEVGHYVVSPAVSQHIDVLASGIGEHCDAEARSLLEECYAGRTLSEGMGRLLARLLGERGLFVIEGGTPTLKKMAAPLWARIIEVGPALHKLLYGRNILLSKLGFAPVLSPTPSAYLFYLTGKEPIRQVVGYDGTLRSPDGKEGTLTLNELHDRVTSHPEDLSPKAALRPLYQDFVLPTVAYVAGPDEVAYHAQIQPFYTTLSVVAPTLFPRLSVTLVDEKTVRMSQKVDLGLRDVLRGDFDALSARVLEDADGTSVTASLQETLDKLQEAMTTLRESLGELDLTLQDSAAASLGKMLHLLDEIEEKVRRAQKQKHAVTLQRLRKVFSALKPRGLLNEQGLSTAYFLLRYGRERLLAALDEVPLDGKKHAIVLLPN